MKRLMMLALLAAASLTLAYSPAIAADAAGKAAKAEKKAAGEVKPIRVLVVTGGHAYMEKEFYAMWDRFRGITYGKCLIPDQADMLKPGLEKDYDVIVMFDMVKAISPEQQKAFAELLKRGIGLVAWHHDIGGNQDWEWYHKLIGGRYVLKGFNTIEGKELPLSTFAHDQDMNVHVEDAGHPITKGLKDFTIHDETYGGCIVDPSVHVLLTSDHPKSTRQVAWTNNFENIPVFYLMLGHDDKAWQSKEFRQLMQRGMRWSARQAKMAANGKAAKAERKREGKAGRKAKKAQ